MAPTRKRKESVTEGPRRRSGLHRRTADEAAAPAAAAAVDAATAEHALAIERMLDETSHRLAQTTDTPLHRELDLVVDRYRRMLRAWATQPPTHLQRVILFDCVRALHHRVESRSWRKLRPE